MVDQAGGVALGAYLAAWDVHRAKIHGRCERKTGIVPFERLVHASWLNQVEIYFSIVQREALTPGDFQSLPDLKDRLLRFQEHYEALAQPFQWKFTRRDLNRPLSRLRERDDLLRRAA